MVDSSFKGVASEIPNCRRTKLDIRHMPESLQTQIIRPDLALVYAHLAPNVAMALAYMRCGRMDECSASLEKCGEIMELVATTSAVIEVPPK